MADHGSPCRLEEFFEDRPVGDITDVRLRMYYEAGGIEYAQVMIPMALGNGFHTLAIPRHLFRLTRPGAR